MKASSFNISIRAIEERDLSSIQKIHSDSIKLGTANAFIKSRNDIYYKNWYLNHQKINNPILVAEIEQRIIGWIELSPYRNGREGFRNVREVSYYIDKPFWNNGIATFMMEKIIDHAKDMNIKTLLTFIMDANPASVRIMEKFDFKLWGRLPDILEMPSSDYDHLIFGRKI